MKRIDVLWSAGAVGLLLMTGCVQTVFDEPPEPEMVLLEGRPDSVLLCSPVLSPPDEETIGPNSGPVTLKSGRHEALIRGGAVDRQQRIIFAPERSDTVSIRFEGEEQLHFRTPVALFVSVAHCPADEKERTWHIWRRGEGNALDQKLRTHRKGDLRWTWIESASVFMIAN